MRNLPPGLVMLATLAGCPAPSSPAEPQSSASAPASPSASTSPSAPASTTATASASASSDAAEARPVTIAASYQGRINLPMSEPGTPLTKVPARVIRDARGMAELISMIPSKQISMKQPAPPSDDPLLAKPAIDFTSKMVIVVFRSDTMYVHPKLENPRIVGEQLIIDVVHPPLGDSAHAAAMSGIGTYAAIVIDRFDGKIELAGES